MSEVNEYCLPASVNMHECYDYMLHMRENKDDKPNKNVNTILK